MNREPTKVLVVEDNPGDARLRASWVKGRLSLLRYHTKMWAPRITTSGLRHKL